MNDSFDIAFSSDGLLSRTLYYISPNNVNIFVEDDYKEYEYEEIFERLLPSDLAFFIFPTGGKEPLKEAFTLFGNDNEYENTFFIADGDFDIALGKSMIQADNFVYLERYNIESYLLAEKAVLQFMRPKLRKTMSQTKAIVNYIVWLNLTAPFLKELFSLHCIVQKLNLGIDNVTRGVFRFFTKNGIPNTDALNAYKLEVQALLPNSSIDVEINKMTSVLESQYGYEPYCFVCGKQYIECLSLHLGHLLGRGVRVDDLRASLISNFDVAQLSYLKEQMLSYINIS